MIFANPFSKLNFSLILFLSVMGGCSKQIMLQDSTIEATPQYLEEIKTMDKNDDETIITLQQLQKIRPQEYRIGLGDRFHISVYGEDDLELNDALVKPDGTISLMLIGEVKIADLTINEAVKVIESRYENYIYSPKVSLIPYRLSSSEVTVYGKIERPGTYEITGTMRVLDAVAKAGGLSTGLQLGNSVELADLESSYVVRNSEILPVDFIELMRKGNMLHNIPLKNGDYIYISSAVNREVYVIGEVIRAGHFPYREDMTVIQSLSFANGMKETAYHEAIVIRGGLTHPRMFKIDMKAVLQGKTQDFPLKPNDIVYIPRGKLANWNKIVNLILPSMQALQSGWLIHEMINDIGN